MAQGHLHIRSARPDVSEAEWEARVNLAACYRLVDLYGMSDLTANHISARVPGEEGHFLINPYGMMYEEITASSLLKIDLDGNVISKPDFDYGVNRAGFVIHSAIHAVRHDVDCVLHTHTAAGMAVSSMAEGLLMITQTAMRFKDIAYHDFEGVAVDLDERERLVRDLGTTDAMILRNHGLLTCGSSIAKAFNIMHRLELSCRAQVMMGGGGKLNTLSDNLINHTHGQFKQGVIRPKADFEWPALLRQLDRRDPTYRD